MNKNIEKVMTLGGSVETALSGNYELKINSILKEGWKCSTTHFFSFLPAVIVLLAVWGVGFYIALTLQLDDLVAVFGMVNDQNPMSQAFFDTAYETGFLQACLVAFLTCQVIAAPVYAAVSMMALSHTAGLSTKTAHIMRGFSYTLPTVIAVLFILMLREIANRLLPFLSLYFSVAFSNAILLICEKRVPPMRSLLLSFKAANKKLLPLIGIHLILGTIILISLFYYGIFLLITLPFFFHVKGVIYRNMFGVAIKMVVNDDNDHPDNAHHDSNKNSEGRQNDSRTDTDSDIFNA